MTTHQSALSRPLARHPRRWLGTGLGIIGAVGVLHVAWGTPIDAVAAIVGAAGWLWAAAARHADAITAGILLCAIALFALLDDRGLLLTQEFLVTLFLLAAVIALVIGLPTRWAMAWPVAPAVVLALVGLAGGVRIVAHWSGLPWQPLAPIAVALVGATLILGDYISGHKL